MTRIDDSFYTGITSNLERRVKEHNEGKSLSTKGKLPVSLVYWESFPDKYKAARYFARIKGWSRLKKQNLISKFTLSQLS